ncbi:YolD-like family protein [Parablautia muri]|uniref:YolD-like family protein n=1 Tax=Parablautia muri TaxID=2320879 RepID=A0A9X5GSH5_9FIRM|nr:YolD-like family protein [Parablautia muri]NBJ92965.1 hypothetical protein [Parablautia muri]
MRDQKVSDYEDMINLPRHISKGHPPMPIMERAAQFSPFAALTGYEDAIKETGRLTDERAELDEDEKTVLDKKLRILKELEREQPEVAITYFKPDAYKAGGAYVTAKGSVKKIDVYEGVIRMQDGTSIPVEDLTEIDGEVFFAL